MRRRNFIIDSSKGALFLAMHPEPMMGMMKTDPDKDDSVIGRTEHLISNITLQTHIPLDKMKTFYSDLLGLTIKSVFSNRIVFNAGKSTVTFTKIDNQLTKPWYHFAFNIPENKILSARSWQLQRTALIPTPKRLRDPKFPSDVRHFRNWNAHSIFFYDPAGNLLEFIARHDLQNGSDGTFSVDDILNISEIAFVVDDQQAEAHRIGQHLGLNVYPKSARHWWAMGDENGLLLCIPKRIFGENTPNPKRFDVFNTDVEIIKPENLKYSFDNFPYEISTVNQ